MIHRIREVRLTKFPPDRADLSCEPLVNALGIRNVRLERTPVPYRGNLRASDLGCE